LIAANRLLQALMLTCSKRGEPSDVDAREKPRVDPLEADLLGQPEVSPAREVFELPPIVGVPKLQDRAGREIVEPGRPDIGVTVVRSVVERIHPSRRVDGSQIVVAGAAQETYINAFMV